MNLRPIEPINASTAQSASPTKPAAKPSEAPRPAPRSTPPANVAALSTPAATATISVPASVKPEDRTLYMQILKALGGNTAAALAALSAFESKQQAACK
jgi:hypothetical protein